MATVKVKFRASSVEMKEGSLYYQADSQPSGKTSAYRLQAFPLGMGWHRDRDGFRHRKGAQELPALREDRLADDLSRFRSIIARSNVPT